MTLRHFRTVLARRWRPALLIFVSTFACCVAVLRSGTEQFVATSTLLIGPDPAALQGLPSPVPTAAYQSFRSKQLSLAELPIATRAVALMLGQASFASTSFKDPNIASQLQDLRSHYQKSVDSASPQLARELIKQTSTDHISRAQLVKVSVVDTDPSIALLKSWAVAEAAEQFHVERVLAPTSQFRSRLNQRLTEVDREIAEAHVRRIDLTKENPQLPVRIRALNSALQDLWVERGELRSKLALRDKQLTREDGLVAGEAPTNSLRLQEVTAISDALDQEIVTLAELRAVMKESAPKVQQALSRIAALRDRLDEYQDPSALSTDNRSLILEEIRSQEQEIRLRLDAIDAILPEFEREHATLTQARFAFTPIEIELVLLESIQRRIRAQLIRYEAVSEWPSGSVTPFELAKSATPIELPGSGRWILVIVGCLGIALGMIVFREVSDGLVSLDRHAQHLGLPTLAKLPFSRSPDSRKITAALFPIAPIVDQLRARGQQKFMIVSAQPRDGRTTIVNALTSHFEQRGDRVTLLHAGEIDRSSLTSIHSPRPNQDRVILIDTPALGLCGDALGLGDSVDSALFVINQSRTTLKELHRCLSMLELANVPVIGFIANETGKSNTSVAPTHAAPETMGRRSPLPIPDSDENRSTEPVG